MFKNYQKEEYWVYDCQSKKWVARYNSKRALLNFFFSKTPIWCHPEERKSKESVFDQINMNGVDECAFFDIWKSERVSWIRKYLVMDADNRIIDIREWNVDKILEEPYKPPRRKKSKFWRMNTNHRRCWGHYRSPRYIGELRDARNPEFSDFTRGSKKKEVLARSWGSERYAPAQKSWKYQTKDRYQWEHNLK